MSHSCYFICILVVYCPDNYGAQKLCGEATDDSLAAFKLMPDWFVTSKMIKKLYSALYVDDGLLFLDEDPDDVTFCCAEMGILNVTLSNNNLNNNFDEDDPNTIILIGHLA